MTKTTMGALREIQKLDDRIRELEVRVAAFEPQLAEVEEPALVAESELAKAEERLEQMEADARRLERSADDKRARAAKLDDRLSKVSNLREEAAVRSELDLTRKAIEGDEQEALQIIDRIRRTEVAVEEMRTTAEEAREAVEPRQRELLADQAELTDRLALLRGRRDTLLEDVGPSETKVYESFHESGRSVVVASLLEDGACGHCFGLIPLQLQNEIRRGSDMYRCEACGVILTTEPEPSLEDTVGPPVQVDGEAQEESDVPSEANNG